MRNRFKRRRLQTYVYVALAIFVFGMGIGYAALSETLTIDGTTDIDEASWNVHFDNVQIVSGSVAATTEPTITDNTSIGFGVTLENPGDFYEFTVDVVNEGTLDAKVNAITILPVLTAEESNFFQYSVTYLDKTTIHQGDPLDAGSTETILVRFEYLVLGDTSLYPTSDTSFSFNVSMNYVQGQGTHVNGTYYSTGAQSLTIGSHIPVPATLYNTYQEAITQSGYDFFLKQVITNNKLTESYVGFVLDDTVYYLRGGDATFVDGGYSPDSPYYETNRATLLSAFGSSNCTEDSSRIVCSTTDFQARADKNGYVHALSTSAYWECDVQESGLSRCAYQSD